MSALLLGGCISDRRVKSKAIEHLANKYEEEFYLEGSGYTSYLSDQFVIYCRTEESKNEQFLINVYPESVNGSVVFTDNYFNFHIKDDIADYVSELVEDSFNSECAVLISSELRALPNSLTKDSSLDDLYRECPNYWVSARAYLPYSPETDYDLAASRLEESLREDHEYYTVRICVVDAAVYCEICKSGDDDFLHYYARNRQPDNNVMYYTKDVEVYDKAKMDELLAQ